jgi:hypothetical protein
MADNAIDLNDLSAFAAAAAARKAKGQGDQSTGYRKTQHLALAEVLRLAVDQLLKVLADLLGCFLTQSLPYKMR